MPEKQRKKSEIQITIFVHCLIIFFVLAAMIFSPLFNISAESTYNLWAVVSLMVYVWMVWSWLKIKKGLFNPYGIFLLAAFLFNLSPVILSILPGNESTLLQKIFPLNIVNLTLQVVTVSFLGLHLGALIAYTFVLRQKPRLSLAISDKDLAAVGYFLILLSLYPLYLTTKESISISLTAGYNSLYSQSIGTGILAGPSVVANFIVPGILFLLAGGKKSRANRLISIILIVTYTISQLVLGKRAIGIMPLIAYLWLWHKTIRPLRVVLLSTVSFIFLIFIFPFVRMSRNLIGVNRLSWQTVTELFTTSNPLFDVLNEMGGTMQTISHTIQIIPSFRPFDHGISYLYSLSTVIPNIFWQVHPIIKHGTFGSWLISIIDPSFARAGGSMGFSFVAEAYANFGIYGSMSILILIGFLFVWFAEYVEKSNDRALLVILASYMSFFLFFARSESYAIIRPLVWYSIVPLLIYIGIIKIRRRNA